MGHQHLGTLPGSRKWRQVVQLISGGADVQDIAAATSAAAENQMVDASNDPAVKHAVWLLTQIPAAARKEDFASELRKLDLRISDRPTLIEVAAAMTDAVERYVGKTGGRTALGTVKQFAVLARDFFSRLSRRQLSYFLSRELSQHVGVNSRFHTIRDHRDFENALDLHCREASRIIKEFSGEWFSKHTYEGGINEAKAGRFAHVAFHKLREELRHRRGAYV
jgi:hypothetical protein